MRRSPNDPAEYRRTAMGPENICRTLPSLCLYHRSDDCVRFRCKAAEGQGIGRIVSVSVVMCLYFAWEPNRNKHIHIHIYSCVHCV